MSLHWCLNGNILSTAKEHNVYRKNCYRLEKMLRNGIQTECLEPLSFPISLFSNTHTYIILCLWFSIRLQYFTIRSHSQNFYNDNNDQKRKLLLFICLQRTSTRFCFWFSFFFISFFYFFFIFIPIRIYIFLLISLQKNSVFFFSLFQWEIINHWIWLVVVIACSCFLLIIFKFFLIFFSLSSASNALQWRQKSEIYRCGSTGKMRFAVNLLTFSIQKSCVCARVMVNAEGKKG